MTERDGRVEAGGGELDARLIPAGAVLDVERHDVAERVDPAGPPGVVQLHQGEQALHLRLVWQQLGDDRRQADRFPGQRHARDVDAAGRVIALVEHEVQHGEHTVEPLGELIRRAAPGTG